jgi:CheY-like chemotaxis protein
MEDKPQPFSILPISYVFLDMAMPQMNGLQVLQEIKRIYKAKNFKYKHVVIEEPVYIFLTGFSSEILEPTLKKAGVESCHMKPLETGELM